MKKLYLLSIFTYFFLSIGITNGYGGCMDYGMAIETYNGYCQCMSGYRMSVQFGRNYCISDSQYCSDTYGIMARYDILKDQCSCSYGYVFGKGVLGNLSCISGNTACSNQFGIMSEYDSLSNKCQCVSGYVFEDDAFGNSQCVYGNNICRKKLGTYSSYDSYAKNCKCDDGYTIKENGQCELKSNSAYFFLKEQKDDDAIIYSTYTKKTFHIEYRSGCNSAWKYIEKSIVINMGTDFSVDRGDWFVLQDNDQNCSISSVEEVSDTFTFKTCEEVFGSNTEDFGTDQCRCSSGYEWNIGKTACISSVGYYTPVTPTVIQTPIPVVIKEVPLPILPNIQNSDIVKIKVEKVFDKLMTSYRRYNTSEQLNKLKNLYTQLGNFDGKFKDDNRIFILKYLKYLVTKKEMELDPSSMTIGELYGY